MKRICSNCGEPFEDTPGKRPRKFCTIACRSENQKRLNEWKRKLAEKAKKEAEAEKINKLSLADAQREARKAGMTYGQFYAEMQKKKVKIERRTK